MHSCTVDERNWEERRAFDRIVHEFCLPVHRSMRIGKYFIIGRLRDTGPRATLIDKLMGNERTQRPEPFKRSTVALSLSLSLARNRFLFPDRAPGSPHHRACFNYSQPTVQWHGSRRAIEQICSSLFSLSFFFLFSVRKRSIHGQTLVTRSGCRAGRTRRGRLRTTDSFLFRFFLSLSFSRDTKQKQADCEKKKKKKKA